MVRQDSRIHTRSMHPHTYKHKQKQKLLQREKMGKKTKKLLTSIMVKQYYKHCVVKREHINSEAESRL
jgi:hypothetical protein